VFFGVGCKGGRVFLGLCGVVLGLVSGSGVVLLGWSRMRGGVVSCGGVGGVGGFCCCCVWC